MSVSLLSFSCRIGRHHYMSFIKSSSVLQRGICTNSTELPPLPFTAMPGPNGTLQTLLEYARGGGIPNLCELQRKRFERYGPIFKEALFNRRVVNIGEAKAISEVLRTQVTFPTRPGFEAYEKCLEKHNHINGLASNDRELWYKERVLLSKTMMRPKEVNLLYPGFNAVSREAVKRIRASRKDGVFDNLENELFSWAAETVCTFLFNERLGFYKEPPEPTAVSFVQAALQLNDAAGKLLYGLPLYKYITTPAFKLMQDAVNTIFALGYNMVNETEAKKARRGEHAEQRAAKPLHDVLVESSQFTSKQIVNILIGMMNAGIDTTTIVGLWTIYLLSKYPEKQEKLYTELSSVIGPHGEVSSKSVNQLPFLKACVKESMRLRPPTIVTPRKFDHGIDVLGYAIPANVDIMLYTLVTSTSEEHYGSDAKDYVPERWMRGNHQEPSLKDEYNAFASIPFGYGVRMCLGRRIAEAELYSLLSQLILNFHMEYVGSSEPKQYVSAFVKPDRPLRIKFSDR